MGDMHGGWRRTPTKCGGTPAALYRVGLAAAEVLLVAVGGAVGTLMRVVPLGLVPGHAALTTLSVNVAGSLAIGVLAKALHGSRVSKHIARALLAGGILGGLTTFSGAVLEAADLSRADALAGVGYAFATMLSCLAAAEAGAWLWGATRGADGSGAGRSEDLLACREELEEEV
jgi:CrcB protein